MYEEPLHLIPRHLRKEFEKMLGVHIEGDLCPVCRYKLIHEYAGKYEEFPVYTAEFSKRSRVGIGVVPPVDPNNQDTSVLIGSEDISKLDLYSEGDPRVLELNGALNIGNRGVVEFIEVFKNEIEYLHCMRYLHQLWGRGVAMETLLDGQRTLLNFIDGKFSIKKPA